MLSRQWIFVMCNLEVNSSMLVVQGVLSGRAWGMKWTPAVVENISVIVLS